MNKTVFTFEEFKVKEWREGIMLQASKVRETACDQRIKKAYANGMPAEDYEMNTRGRRAWDMC